MSRYNQPIKTGPAGGLPLAAIAPATPDAEIGVVGGIGTAMPAAGGGLLAMRRDHVDPATR